MSRTKLVEVVQHAESGRLRVRPIGKRGWVRFPKRLRQEGAIYEVESLHWNTNLNCWVAEGNIRQLHKGRSRKYFSKSKKSA